MKATTLYSVPQVANLTVSGVNARMHMIIASTYGRTMFRVFRRAQNILDFLVRDVDRRPVNLEGTLTMIVYDDFGNTVLEKDLVVENETRAHYRLTITAAETLTVTQGLYNWTVRFTDDNEIKHILYTNHDYVVHGIMEVNEGFLVPVDDPYTITDFTPDNGQYLTSTYPGAIKVNNFTGNHSVAVYIEDFTGTILVDTSLDLATPTNDADWVMTTSEDYTAATGTFVINFDGNYNFVRFRTTSTDGLTKLVYRN